MMKTAIKTSATILLCLLLLTNCEKWPELTLNIPDDHLLTVLIEQGIDQDNDGEISRAEAEMITSLIINDDSISDMTGIEAFINLDTLICSGNQISSLDVSNMDVLLYLECSSNQIKTLDVSRNTSLLRLGCGHNQIETLDVSGKGARRFVHWLY